jgi:hypothetical protein
MERRGTTGMTVRRHRGLGGVGTSYGERDGLPFCCITMLGEAHTFRGNDLEELEHAVRTRPVQLGHRILVLLR